MPVVGGMGTLEYDLTSRIRLLTNRQVRTVGIAVDYGAYDMTASDEEVQGALKERYEVVRVPLEQGTTVESTVDALVVLGPTQKLSEESLFVLDQFLMSGKPLMLALNAYTVSMQSFYATAADTGLAPLVNHYGLAVEPGLVLDRNAQTIAVRQMHGFFAMQNMVPYAYVPLVQDLATVPMVKDLEALSFPFAASLAPAPARAGQVSVTPLARSSPRSWRKTTMYNVSPFEPVAPGSDSAVGPFTLAAIVEGGFTSYFADRAMPEKYAAAGYELLGETAENRLLVTGSGTLFNREFPIVGANLAFFLNAVDWLLADEALVSIRSKNVSFTPIGNRAPPVRVLFTYVNILLMPLVVIGYGLFRWRMRSRYRARVRQELA